MSWDLTAWYAFLEEECQKPEGLLCFYDKPQLVRLECLHDLVAAWLGLGESPWDKGQFPPRLVN